MRYDVTTMRLPFCDNQLHFVCVVSFQSQSTCQSFYYYRRGSIPAKGKITSSPKSPDRLWIPPRLQIIPRIFLQRRNGQYVKLTTNLHLAGRLGCRDSSVGIATRYWLDGPGIESRWLARFSAPVQIGPGAHPASYKMSTGSFPGVKRPGRGDDHPPPI
jgi:hypothetical protein